MMSTTKKRTDFYSTEEGVITMHELLAMADDKKYNTVPSYSANTVMYPNNAIPFVDKHMVYLRDHPGINPEQYLANLRLMTKRK